MEDSVMMMTNSTKIKPMETETENKEEQKTQRGEKNVRGQERNTEKLMNIPQTSLQIKIVTFMFNKIP